ncbi:MAG: TIGR04282 family arsenosugar biosynthesis glycosyltransferase [Pseudomonadota bacterium]
MASSDSTTLILFAKNPDGIVKTRLASVLGMRAAQNVYQRLLTRTMEVVEASLFQRRLVMVANAADHDHFEQRLAQRPVLWEVGVQCQGDLGRRMRTALAGCVGEDSAALLIGSDLADIEASDLNEALLLLADADQCVIGPAVDGGYWAFGCRSSVPEVFEQVSWSSGAVYRQTTSQLDALGVSWHRLPTRHDIDRPHDLERFPSLLA